MLMTRTRFNLLVAFLGMAPMSVPVLAILAIMDTSWRLAGVSVVMFAVSFPVCTFIFFLFSECWDELEKSLPRKARRQLRDELARIELDKRIKEAEKEAGLL